MIVKNKIPVLEFDTDINAVINPNHENLNIKFPKKCVYAFAFDFTDKLAKEMNAKVVSEFVSATKNYPIYTFTYKNEEIALVSAPVGSAPSVQIMDWLIAYGVCEIIGVGSCGALFEDREGEFLIPYKALRDEGTSYHYVAPDRFIDINTVAVSAIEKTLSENKLGYRKIITWTTDGFYRETKEMVEYRKSEGCMAVEMECSALAACAQMRKVIFGMLLFTGDTLANLDKHCERTWGKNSVMTALKLCIDAVMNI